MYLIMCSLLVPRVRKLEFGLPPRVGGLGAAVLARRR
jgi:hypothetical protein